MKAQAVRLMDKTVIFYISNTGSIPVPPTMNISLITSKVEILPTAYCLMAAGNGKNQQIQQAMVN